MPVAPPPHAGSAHELRSPTSCRLASLVVCSPRSKCPWLRHRTPAPLADFVSTGFAGSLFASHGVPVAPPPHADDAHVLRSPTSCRLASLVLCSWRTPVCDHQQTRGVGAQHRTTRACQQHEQTRRVAAKHRTSRGCREHSDPGWSRTIVSCTSSRCRDRWTTGPIPHRRSGGSGGRTRHLRLMRPDWALAHPLQGLRVGGFRVERRPNRDSLNTHLPTLNSQ